MATPVTHVATPTPPAPEPDANLLQRVDYCYAMLGVLRAQLAIIDANYAPPVCPPYTRGILNGLHARLLGAHQTITLRLRNKDSQ